jgi:endonuclease YncB( thermonuclease family)
VFRRGAGLWATLLTAAILAAGHEAWTRWNAAVLTGSVDVIDGDSLRLEGVELRLEGIDAPEYNQTCRHAGVDEPCGKQARQALVALIGKGKPTCEVASHDRYGRGLALCRLGSVEINRQMVAQGHAVSFGMYAADEARARQARLGIWATTFESPADWRGEHPRH